MNDKELKLECFKIALQNLRISVDTIEKDFDKIKNLAEKIYNFISSPDK